MTEKNIEIFIENEGVIYKPLIQDSVTWETERTGVPGKLSFSIVNVNGMEGQEILSIQEGNRVTMRYGGEPVFTGFLFSKKRSKDQIISITAYDQTRYLKNEHYYRYENKTASQLLYAIAEDFQLSTGEVEDTGIPLTRREDGKTLFDIILNALDDTVRLTGKLFVLYDDFGKLALRNAENLKLDFLITETAAQNFNYETSIDSDVYNRVHLYYDDEERKKRRVFFVHDSYNEAKWGILQLCKSIQNPELGEQMAEGYMKLYNHKRRTFSISGVTGDIRARAGFSVPVSLILGDVNAESTYFLIEKAKHTFADGSYTMDITLRGNGFV